MARVSDFQRKKETFQPVHQKIDSERINFVLVQIQQEIYFPRGLVGIQTQEFRKRQDANSFSSLLQVIAHFTQIRESIVAGAVTRQENKIRRQRAQKVFHFKPVRQRIDVYESRGGKSSLSPLASQKIFQLIKALKDEHSAYLKNFSKPEFPKAYPCK